LKKIWLEHSGRFIVPPPHPQTVFLFNSYVTNSQIFTKLKRLGGVGETSYWSEKSALIGVRG